MIIIAHRGNLSGPHSVSENTEVCIENAIQRKYQVEIDLWDISGVLYLGCKSIHV